MCIYVVGVCFFFFGGGGGKGNLKLLRSQLIHLLQFVNMYQRRNFCRGGKNECKTTLVVTGTSSNLLTCINVFFLFYI